MANLGTAYIKIAPDLSGVQGKISRGLGTAGSEAGSASGKQFGSAFSRFASDPIVNFGNKVIKGTLVAGAVAAGALIAKNLGSAISRVDTLNNFPKIMANLGYEAGESRKAISLLDKGVQGLPTSLDGIAGALQNIAPSTKSLGYATDLTLALNNALVAGGKSTDIQATAMEQFSQAIAKGKPDMMEWRSLATAMPGQLKQISNSLGYENWQKMAKAVSDGDLEFSKVQDTFIELNKKGLGEFPSFADQAKSAAGGLRTGIANMNTAVSRGIASIITAIGSENISNAISGIGKGFESALKVVANFFAFFKENSDVMIPITIALGTFATIAGTLAGIVKGVALAQALWNAAMLSNPIVLITTALVALVAGLVYFFTQTETGRKIWETFTNYLTTAWGVISTLATTVWQTVKDAVLGAVTGVSEAYTAAKDTIVNMFNAVKEEVQLAFENIKLWIEEHQTALINWGIVITTLLLPKIAQIGFAFIASAAQAVASFVTMSVQAVVHFGAVAGSAVVNAIKTSAAWVASSVKTIATWVAALPKVIANFVAMSASAVVNALKAGAAWVAQAIRTAAQWAVTFAAYLKGVALAAAQTLIAGAKMAAAWLLALGPIGLIVAAVIGAAALIIANWEAVKTFFVNAWNTIKQTGVDAWNGIKAKWQEIKTWFSNIDLAGSGKALIDGLVKGISDGFNAAKDFVGGKMSELRGLFPFSPAKEGPFSGKGYTTHSGKALIEDFAKGIGDNAHKARNAAMGALSGIKGDMDYEIGVNGGDYTPASRAKQPATFVFQVGSKEIAQTLVNDINDMSFLNGRSVIEL